VPLVLPPSQLNRVFRFGDFDLLVRAGELRKNGELVRLQQQPLRVLLALLEHSGEVITRDEIRERVWPAASIQDFDNSLRVAINKLRQALEDDPEKPRYIETLPRRGYRWLYPVTFHDSPLPALENGKNTLEESHGAESPISVLGVKDAERRVGLRSVLFTVVLVLIAIAAAVLSKHPAAPSESRVIPLTSYPGLEYMPSISPDSTRVAFAWTGPNATDPYGVYIKPIHGERAQRLAETPAGAADSDPVWSPDGGYIYFARRGAGQTGIYVVPSEGGSARQVIATALVNQRLRRARFDISPTEKLLVYPDEIPGKDTIALFLLDLNTMQRRQVTSPVSNSEGDGDPAFSHDGKTVAFQRNTLDRQQIYVMPAKGGEARLLMSNFVADFIDGLAWSADDREIIFGGKQLRRVSVTSDQPVVSNIMFVPGPSTFPVLRGNLVAYVLAAVNANIWKLSLRDATHAAGDPVKLISSTRQQAAASFSPDGSRIVFQSDRSGYWEIWTCNRDGSEPVQITHFNGPLTGTPRWSPDGKEIVFDSRASGISQIYVVPAGGGESSRITNAQDGGDVPSWSRDGKWIYYSAKHRGLQNLWKVSVSGGAPKPLTTNGGIYGAESPDAKYVYFSRGSHDPTIWRIPVEGGAEEQVKGISKPFDCSHWVVVGSGIYFVDPNGDLAYYSPSKATSTRILHDQRLITDWSMAVSPDGREIIWAQIDDRSADLMLVENFH